MKALESIATINLWEGNYWEERKPLLVKELRKNYFTAEHPTILACQEVSRKPFYNLSELALELGFSKKHIYFFPTIVSGDFGLGVVTNLHVKAKSFTFFSYDSTDPLEFGQRGIALLQLEDGNGPIVLGVTHLSVSEKMQYVHAVETIQAVNSFGALRFNLSTDMVTPDAGGHFTKLCDLSRVLIAGDFNASPLLPMYELFGQAGLTDFTFPIHKKYPFSWPSDPEWLVRLHLKRFGKRPNFDAKTLQRWMDYIWGCGFAPINQVLLGRNEENGMYPSDHLIPAVYF